jgi:PAS domain S-box-containing protein
VQKRTDNEVGQVWNKVMKTPVFSAVHTAACRPEQALIQCRDSTRPDDEYIRTCAISDRLLAKWQSMVDTSAQLADVPVALIMRVVNPNIQVLVSSNSAGNPYHAGETAPLESSAAYCETVIRTGERLLVANALTGPDWMGRSSGELKMISYLGLPILWPNRRVFGTICVLDHKENSFSVSFERVLRQFRNLIEVHLECIYTGSDVDSESVCKSGLGREGLELGEERLRSLIDRVTDGVLVHDANGIVAEINQQACLSIGWTREQLLGKNIGQLPVQFDVEWNSRQWALAQAGDMTVVRATRQDVNDGIRVLDARFSCQIAHGRKMFLGLIRDITEPDTMQDSHRACEAELGSSPERKADNWRWNVKQAEDAVGETHVGLSRVMRWAATGELAASLVHEVNQPLGVIANYAGAIKHWLGRSEPNMREAQDAASRLSEAVACAGNIISELKVFARDPNLELSDVEISAAVREILVFVRHQFEQRSVGLETRLPAESVTVRCDRVLLQHVLLNLLHNALESVSFGSEGTRHVWLTCEQIGTGGVEVAITENGIGLNESNGETLFEPLPMNRKEQMGTGLSVCRTIVGAHGGRLWTEPRPEGGTTFRFVLPGKKPVH